MGVHVPDIARTSLWQTVTVVVEKVMSHPASHMVPMDTSKWDCSAGRMWAIRAVSGKSGMGNSAR